MSDAGLTLREGMELAGLDPTDLWERYVALGGNGTVSEVLRHVTNRDCPDDREHNLIAQAINEAFLERGQDHPVAYRHLYAPPGRG